MKAIILAAGVGSRLGDITKSIPKCLINIGNKTILEYQIKSLKANNINNISIVIGYYADKVKEVLKNSGVKFYLNKDYDKTGMLESLYCAKKELHDDIILLYGDTLFEADVVKRLLVSNNEICLMVDREKNINYEAENAYEEYHGEKLKKGSTKVFIVDNSVRKISKSLPPNEVSGEYIGLVKIGKKGLKIIVKKIEELKKSGEIKKAPSPSYLFQWLIDNGHKINVTYTDNLLIQEIDYKEDIEEAKKKFSKL